MKSYILVAFLVGLSLAQTCQKFSCGSLTSQCVGMAAATADVTVQACPSGNFCNAIANPLTVAGMAQLKNGITTNALTCTAIPEPAPVTYSGISGDACSANTDCKDEGFTCSSGACRNSAAKADATCAGDRNCDLGFWCNAGKCAAVVAPGGACTAGATPTTFVSQCGFQAYCLNNVCVNLYSQAIGY